MNEHLAKEILKGKFEKTDRGELYLPGSHVFIGGVFGHWLNDDVEGIQYDGNIVVDEGLDHILDVALSNGTQNSNWYVGIFKNNHTPVAGDVAASFAGAGVAGEIITEVDESARQAYTDAGVSSQQITNTASPATFTANQSVAAYGAFLISDNTMGGLSGVLCAASKFTAVRNLVDTDVLNVTYQLTIADA